MEWISVKDRLPDNMFDGDDFLIATHDGTSVTLGFWNAFEGRDNEGGQFLVNNSDYDYGGLFPAWNVTHWMPLPEPPKDNNIKEKE